MISQNLPRGPKSIHASNWFHHTPHSVNIDRGIWFVYVSNNVHGLFITKKYFKETYCLQNKFFLFNCKLEKLSRVNSIAIYGTWQSYYTSTFLTIVNINLYCNMNSILFLNNWTLSIIIIHDYKSTIMVVVIC